MNLRRTPKKPSIEAIHLNIDGWNSYNQESYRWIRPGPDMLQLLYFDKPTQLPCSLDDEPCWTPYFADILKPLNGAIVSVKTLPIQGLKAVQTIFKFHQRKMSGLSDLGITYLGTWMVPFAEFSFNIQVQCFESGDTGLREAGVMMILLETEPQPKETPTEPPRHFTSGEEYFDMVRTRPMIRLRADDEEWDRHFPDHPLSRLRVALRHIAETLTVDDMIRNARPFINQIVK